MLRAAILFRPIRFFSLFLSNFHYYTVFSHCCKPYFAPKFYHFAQILHPRVDQVAPPDLSEALRPKIKTRIDVSRTVGGNCHYRAIDVDIDAGTGAREGTGEDGAVSIRSLWTGGS